ncbi:uncharacterized protein PV09_07227 [Verruconis gallopava]|uniref:non-specific serine/threonine protein kinase n=1 Tax=Verruconis gallopava TaxID=253628 RepID=A0A0D1XGZ2_9PEZI|nr:uncharacterized protein PV09_07227 [Verruconis gallopava]KIW01471.1 hypothetical protein PV09_07227 [Verruconis gallopava]
MERPPPSQRRLAPPAEPSVIVGDFQRLEEIGKGSFATVFRGKHLKTGAIIAIKSVNVKKLTKKLQDNLEAEVRILRDLHHPHIVSLFDCKRTADKVHLCMEYCEMGDLSTFIKRRNQLAEQEITRDMIKKYPLPQVGGLNEVIVRHFVKQIASALSFMREKALLHRDIKPQNLLLVPPRAWYQSQSGSRPPVMTDPRIDIPAAGVASLPILKIADFGFARFLPSLELAETLCGSPLYMAPEILRYEKYDAKADLWSVGTVLHEMMVGKPPFRANNHVELLRKIEKNEDVIRFPTGLVITPAMKNLIRVLLKRIPTERVSYETFFNDPVVTEQIPGLVGEDRPQAQFTQNLANRISRTRPSLDSLSNSPRESEVEAGPSARSPSASVKSPTVAGPSAHRQSRVPLDERRESATRASPKPLAPEARAEPAEASQASPIERRPSLKSHATAPATEKPVSAAAMTMERRNSRATNSPGGSVLKDHLDRERGKTDDKALRDAREKTAQDIAFEREYVVVEKRHVEVNAFADELAHSPQVGAQGGAMVRRATTSGVPYSSTAPSSTGVRAMQQVSRQMPLHQRTGSYERRYGKSPTSATSAISKALNMASFRLFSMGLSPPSGKGPSPPQYSAFPAYPTGSSMLLIGDGATRAVDSRDDDFRVAHQIEDLAHRSDVIWGFADIKFQQLVPSRPISSHGVGIGGMRRAMDEAAKNGADEESELPVDHVVVIAEESLVLFVKVLAVLKKIMDISAAWFHNSRGELLHANPSDVPRSAPTRGGMMAAAPRINSVVQWARTRFNDALEKSDFVARKLTDAQKRLPLDHPHHPNNKYSSSSAYSATSVGTSSDHVILTSGITAEKLMYDRALEMSRGAAVCELTNEDLENGVLSYRTAIYMLEAILDSDDWRTSRKSVGAAKGEGTEDEPIDGLEAEDRATVQKLLDSLKIRLRAIKKKIEAQKAARRSSTSGTPTMPMRASPSTTPQYSRSPAR